MDPAAAANRRQPSIPVQEEPRDFLEAIEPAHVARDPPAARSSMRRRPGPDGDGHVGPADLAIVLGNWG